MHSTPPTFNPSQAVERIREIIVGRQLERLEQRIAQLEAPLSKGTVTDLTPLEDRILASEARLEALHASVAHLVETQREENERRAQIMREETQRLERKLGAWLGDWQQSLSLHLDAREQKMMETFHAELSQLWKNIEDRLTNPQSHSLDSAPIEQRFDKIAEVALPQAECASTTVESPAPRH